MSGRVCYATTRDANADPVLRAVTFRAAQHDYPIADRLVWTYGRVVIDTTAGTLTVCDNGRTFALAPGARIVAERA